MSSNRFGVLGSVENSDGEGEEDLSSLPSKTPSQQSTLANVSFKTLHSPVKGIIGASTPLAAFSPGGTPSLGLIPGGSSSKSKGIGLNPHFVQGDAAAAPPTTAAASKARATEFAKSMKVLNAAFTTSCQSAISRDPSHSLIPLVKDYLHHSRGLLEEGNEEQLGGTSTTSAPIPTKSWKTLGEFFEKLEQNFIEKSKSRATETSEVTSQSAFQIQSVPTTSRATSSVSIGGNAAIGTTGKLDNGFDFTGRGGSAFASSSSSCQAPKTPVEFNKMNIMPFSTPTYVMNPPELSTYEQPAAPAAPFGVGGFPFFAQVPSNPNTFSSFAAPTAPATFAPENNNNDDDENGEGEEDEGPPVNDITRVTELDSVYSTRVKVFGMIDGSYKDKGVGMLYIKKLGSDKYSVVVRGDNNLGTLILNILLQKSLPLEKKSAKDVMTVDLQGNNKKGKGMPILLRTKSENEANDLLNNLRMYQQFSST